MTLPVCTDAVLPTYSVNNSGSEIGLDRLAITVVGKDKDFLDGQEFLEGYDSGKRIIEGY